jgi:hypothetical protein
MVDELRNPTSNNSRFAWQSAAQARVNLSVLSV